ncbi:hypothetical protein E4U58_004253, partial [Claviceps cyperi]
MRYYITKLRKQRLEYDLLVAAIKQRFEKTETTELYNAMWNQTTLQNVIDDDNPTKSRAECFEIVVATLQHLHAGLFDESSVDTILHLQLTTALLGVPEAQLAFFHKSETYDGLLADIRKGFYGDKAPKLNFTTAPDTAAHVDDDNAA